MSVGRIAPYAVAVASLLVAAIVLLTNLGPPTMSPEISPSSEPRTADTPLVAETLDELPVTLRPYPYTEPAPQPVPTEIDGTYMLILTLIVGPAHRKNRCVRNRSDAGSRRLRQAGLPDPSEPRTTWSR